MRADVVVDLCIAHKDCWLYVVVFSHSVDMMRYRSMYRNSQLPFRMRDRWTCVQLDDLYSVFLLSIACHLN